MEQITIRAAAPEDAEALLAIYAPYVEGTVISFEYQPPTVEEFAGRIRRILEKYPYLVAQAGGEVLGYAYAGPMSDRMAYHWAVETSIYVRQDNRKTGVGRLLYQALERALAAQNIVSLNACIAWPEVEDEYLTRNSVQFHQHMGYRKSGHFHRCGHKFGRWYDIVWMEKDLGPRLADQPPVRPFGQVREELRREYGIQ